MRKVSASCYFNPKTMMITRRVTVDGETTYEDDGPATREVAKILRGRVHAMLAARGVKVPLESIACRGLFALYEPVEPDPEEHPLDLVKPSADSVAARETTPEKLNAEPCRCEREGSFYFSGVPGVVAHREKSGLFHPGAIVQHCSYCKRFKSEQEARAELHKLDLFDPEPLHGPELFASDCDCCAPGYSFSGVPGILAHQEANGLIDPANGIERCDLCQRYESDDDARHELERRHLLIRK